MKSQDFNYRKKEDKDNGWVKTIVSQEWGSTKILSKDKMYEVTSLPGFIAEKDNRLVGLILYVIEKECEIVALYSSIEGQGVGTRLIEFVKDIAKQKKCNRVWLQTTNDNTRALRLYQKRGFTIAAFRPNSIEAQRKIKPIPLIGNDGIPIRDEIELELFV